MYILDTDVISELRKVRTGKANPQVVSWFLGRDLASFYISVVNVKDFAPMGVAIINPWD
jgi:predicted nucleic acid-binding protein